MAKSLTSFPKKDRSSVARKRVESGTKGLGYWGAFDFLAKERKGKLSK